MTTGTGHGPTIRDRLAQLGIGQFNATMIVPYAMISPATCDPKSNQVIILLQHIQRALFGLGATDVPDSGRLDATTAAALSQLVGPGWEGMPWSASVTAIVNARASGQRLSPSTSTTDEMAVGMPVAVGGPLDFLPDVPGGLFTYAVAGYFLYRHFTRKGRA